MLDNEKKEVTNTLLMEGLTFLELTLWISKVVTYCSYVCLGAVFREGVITCCRCVSSHLQLLTVQEVTLVTTVSS